MRKEKSLGGERGRDASRVGRLLKGLNQLGYFPCGIIFTIHILRHKILGQPFILNLTKVLK